ncbi:MAG TPA: amidohydrolase family protein [Bryobacteraceae bacterium]|nr:amidohydrolase family protein [Bryobacteraceae bacterium]
MIEYFDCNAAVGVLGAGPPGVGMAAPALAGLMARYGLAGALVCSTASLEYNPREGNRLLAREIAARDNVWPLYTLTPEEGMLEEAAALLPGRPFAALLLPDRDRHNFSLREWCAGPLLAALERRRIPLFLRPAPSGWEEVAALLDSHPRLAVAVTNTGYRADRYIYPLARRCPRLFVETSTYVGHRQLEEFARTFGAARLLFGTNLPYYTPGAAIAALAYARLRDEDRARVAGLNLRELMGEQS